jgi:hypothetical protein
MVRASPKRIARTDPDATARLGPSTPTSADGSPAERLVAIVGKCWDGVSVHTAD